LAIGEVLGADSLLEKLPNTAKTNQFFRSHHGIVRPKLFRVFIL
jgi:hypothetical protein